MYPIIPADAMGGALQMVCCFFTIVAAFISCLFTLR